MKLKLAFLSLFVMSFLACGNSTPNNVTDSNNNDIPSNPALERLANVSEGNGASFAEKNFSSTDVQDFSIELLKLFIKSQENIVNLAFENDVDPGDASEFSFTINDLLYDADLGTIQGSLNINGQFTGSNTGQVVYEVISNLNHYGLINTLILDGDSKMSIQTTAVNENEGSVKQSASGSLSISGDIGAKVDLLIISESNFTALELPLEGSLTFVSEGTIYSCSLSGSNQEEAFNSISCALLE